MRLFITLCFLGLIQSFAYAAITVTPISDTISIKIENFSNKNMVDSLLNKLKPYSINDASSIIIDLRNNNGGFIYEAISIAALFVDQKELITIIDQSGKNLTITRPKDHPFISTKRLLIIMNNNTASAAEGAISILNLHPRSTTFGEQSYGKKRISSISNNHSPYQSLKIPSSGIKPDIPLSFSKISSYDSQILKVISLSNK